MLTVKYTKKHIKRAGVTNRPQHILESTTTFCLFRPIQAQLGLSSAVRMASNSQVLSLWVHVHVSRWGPAQHSTHMADGIHTWAACYQQTGQKEEDEWRLFSSETGPWFTEKRATEWLPGNRTPGSAHTQTHNFKVFLWGSGLCFLCNLKGPEWKTCFDWCLHLERLYTLPINTLMVVAVLLR